MYPTRQSFGCFCMRYKGSALPCTSGEVPQARGVRFGAPQTKTRYKRGSIHLGEKIREREKHRGDLGMKAGKKSYGQSGETFTR